MSEIRNVIVQLLEQFSANREARDYLLRFSSVQNKQFAVIKVGGGVIADELEELAAALAFLRHVGLFPIILHGAGPQLSAAFKKEGIEPRFIDNLRYTDSSVLGIARPVVYQQSQRLVTALDQHNVQAQMIQHGVFECDYLDESRYGLVGEIKRVHLQSIEAVIESGALPIINCFGETPGGQVLNINADLAASALVEAIQPHKIIFLTPTGGLLDESGQIISAINLQSDYERLSDADWVHSGMHLKLQQIKSLLDGLPPTASVSITSARHLTRELFTHRGSGTLVRYGELFDTHDKISDVQRSNLRHLLERCFGRPLLPDYFETRKIHQLVCASSYRAAAIITRDADDIPYLDKFVVTPDAQGEGLSATLWDQLTRMFPKFYWRARSDNPINSWYLKRADAVVRRDNWLVFSVGFSEMAEHDRAADHAVSVAECWQASNLERFL